MKTNMRTIALAAVVVLASLSQTVHAQSDHIIGKLTVPFAFEYGTQQFAPGTYTIKMSGQVVMALTGRKNAMAMTHTEIDNQPAKTSHAVFVKYGNRYFLDEVCQKGNNRHVYAYQSKREREAARDERASLEAAASHIELALTEIPYTTTGN